MTPARNALREARYLDDKASRLAELKQRAEAIEAQHEAQALRLAAIRAHDEQAVDRRGTAPSGAHAQGREVGRGGGLFNQRTDAGSGQVKAKAAPVAGANGRTTTKTRD